MSFGGVAVPPRRNGAAQMRAQGISKVRGPQ